MQMRTVAVVTLALAVLVLPGIAHAKGAGSASIGGPGIGGDGTIDVGGSGEAGSGSDLGALVEATGFWPQVYGQAPDPLLDASPTDDLGPGYRVVYTMPGPNGRSDELVQELYPFASGGPITHMVAGQEFYGTERTHGGWFQGTATLTGILAGVGVPAADVPAPPAPAEPETVRQPSPQPGFDWTPVLLISAALVLITAAGLMLTRRPRTTSTA